MKTFLTALGLAVLLAGCVILTGCSSVVPQKVEFFQDKVKPFPEQTQKLHELERQAVQRASVKASETVVAAVAENASTNVVAPATEAKVLTEAVSVALGPPTTPAVTDSESLAGNLESAVAKYNITLDKFKKTNNENAGKKIEGTGIFQIGYFWWVGGLAAAAVVIFFLGKLTLTAASVANPGAAIGLNIVNAAESLVKKGFTQVVSGGEAFKTWVEKEITDSGLKTKILSAFQTAQIKAQDSDVQNVIAAITK